MIGEGNNMKQQPNFRQIFYDYFGGKPKKVTYSIRSDSNRLHDLMFLKSLIHDVTFMRSEFNIRGKRMTIQLNRDCWELGFVENKKNAELYNANSRLSISPVVDLEWSFNNERGLELDSELWIDDVTISSESFALLNIVIFGDGWKLQMKVSEENFKMSIQDLETPYLFSQKNKKK